MIACLSCLLLVLLGGCVCAVGLLYTCLLVFVLLLLLLPVSWCCCLHTFVLS